MAREINIAKFVFIAGLQTFTDVIEALMSKFSSAALVSDVRVSFIALIESHRFMLIVSRTTV